MVRSINIMNSKKGDNDWKYFDDCPICQAMKEGRANTVEELREAFKEAKRQKKGLVYFQKEDKK